MKAKKETKVLLVVGDKSVSRMLCRLLRKNNCGVDAAETGNQAIQKLNKTSYDLVLADFQLPDADWPSLFSSVQNRLAKSAKIIISSYPSIENSARAFEAGADAYLVKPVKPEDLLMIVKEKLEKHQKNII